MDKKDVLCEENMTNREKCFYSGIIGIIAMIATLYVRISPDDNIDSVKDYIVALLTFMAVTLLTYLIINRLQMRFHLSKWLQGAFLGALTIGEVVLLWGLLRDDDGYLGADVQGFFWHVLPSGLVFLLFVVITIIVVFIYLKNSDFLY